MLSEVHEGLRLGFYGSLKAGMNQAVILCKGITFTEPQLRITTTNVRCIMLESILESSLELRQKSSIFWGTMYHCDIAAPFSNCYVEIYH
ncbi:Protein of unknown function [Pyronema omphalodes CBS 100304]|uniref:Uncharacterized protein n=1 Tax=Pyronema omphalodes (strain CBS 100304) TaxID=1076935 RepID=U4KWF0_PYROM|nr:Protein of unknown function [Pyronema omphalodes CBS 100304]